MNTPADRERRALTVLATLAVFVSACRETYYADKRCVELDRRAAAEFVVACSTAANPKSDEEGEDLVNQCERTAVNLLCAREDWFVGADSYQPEAWVLCRRAIPEAQAICRARGWEGK